VLVEEDMGHVRGDEYSRRGLFWGVGYALLGTAVLTGRVEKHLKLIVSGSMAG